MIAYELRPLVERLRQRYPGIRIVSATMDTTGNDEPQQTIRYQAPLEELKRSGVLTPQMVETLERTCKLFLAGYGETPLGDGFHLCTDLDSLSKPGCSDLLIYTATVPRGRPIAKGRLREAQRELRRLFGLRMGFMQRAIGE